MTNFRFSNQAVKDLEEIWTNTKQTWSLEQADRYYLLIIDEVEFISANPHLGKPIDLIKKGYKSTKVKSHIVYYKLIEDDTIFIVRILHQRMDSENRLK